MSSVLVYGLHAYQVIHSRKVLSAFLISGNGILKREQELNELKAELEAAKLNVQETEKDKVNCAQKYKDLKLKLDSMKATFLSAQKEEIKVCCLLNLITLGLY
jgi:hypothetical protein